MNSEFKRLFPPKLIESVGNLINRDTLQELRIKAEKPCIFNLDNKEIVSDYIVSKEDVKYILQRISNFSLYAFEEDIKQGFITIKGGHRVGLAGECVIEGKKIKTIKNITSLNVRICREIIGCSKSVIKYIFNNSRVKNTLIISPPKCGKTTILRDIARELSDGGKKVAIVDERSEIAACYEGIPQMSLGIRVDVLDNCLKSEGMMMAIRSLSPEVIICDEIGTLSDVESLVMAFNSGVNIVTTVHGFTIEDFLNRKVFNEINENNILERIIVLSNRKGVGTIEGVFKMEKGEKNKWVNIY